MLSLSPQTITNYENNNKFPKIEILVEIADIFQVTTDFLLGIDSRVPIKYANLLRFSKNESKEMIKALDKLKLLIQSNHELYKKY